MNKVLLILTIGFSASLLTACNQNPDAKTATSSKDSVSTTMAANEEPVVFKDPLINTAFGNYIALKNALVSSDVSLAQKAASEMDVALKQIEGCKNTADIAGRISAATAIEQQRKDFTALSDDFIALIKHADVQEGTTYVQYCPMANSGDGGYWMASSKEIRNPYYGDKMLNCGEVKEEISKK